MLRRFIMSDTYPWVLVGGSYGLNIIAIFQIKRLLKSLKMVIDERDDLTLVIKELIQEANQLWRIIHENDVEPSEFDKVILEGIQASLKEIADKYPEENPDA